MGDVLLGEWGVNGEAECMALAMNRSQDSFINMLKPIKNRVLPCHKRSANLYFVSAIMLSVLHQKVSLASKLFECYA